MRSFFLHVNFQHSPDPPYCSSHFSFWVLQNNRVTNCVNWGSFHELNTFKNFDFCLVETRLVMTFYTIMMLCWGSVGNIWQVNMMDGFFLRLPLMWLDSPNVISCMSKVVRMTVWCFTEGGWMFLSWFRGQRCWRTQRCSGGFRYLFLRFEVSSIFKNIRAKREEVGVIMNPSIQLEVKTSTAQRSFVVLVHSLIL